MQKFLQAALLQPNAPFQLQQAIKMTEIPRVQLENKQQGLGWDITPLTRLNQLSIQEPENILSLEPQQVVPLSATAQEYTNAVLIEKTGGTDGFRSYIGFIPVLNRGVVILANRFVPGAAIIKAGRKILFFDRIKNV
jgi:beta-lactamase class C